MTPESHARLTELFGQAIELAASERAALLARVRVDDPALASELAALLEADQEASGGLATGALAPTAHERVRGKLAADAPTMLAPGAAVDAVGDTLAGESTP